MYSNNFNLPNIKLDKYEAIVLQSVQISEFYENNFTANSIVNNGKTSILSINSGL